MTRAGRSLVILLTRPRQVFTGVREPVQHDAVIALLALVRLPPWLLLVTVLGVGFARAPGRPPLAPFALGGSMTGAGAAATSAALLMMVPLGIPLLYFFGGVLSHAALALTGGVRRSVGASMRAFGLAAAPSLLLLSLAEVALHLGVLSPVIWGAAFAVAVLLNFVLLMIGLTRTHEIWGVRTLLVVWLPLGLLYAMVLFRAGLVLPNFPFMPPPAAPSPYSVFPS